MIELPGTPSDDVPGVLAAGRGDVGTLFVSMARRHPEGRDAEYLQWHTLDHRPEQHRLSAVRASLRLVSTPKCRAARPQSVHPDAGRFAEIDHVMTYFFTDPAGMEPFLELSRALGGAGRKLALLPPVERGVYDVRSKAAAPRVKVGADVLPWWPVLGAYLIVHEQDVPTAALLDVSGVAGVWSASALDVGPRLANARAGQRLTYCFLDDDPVTVAAGLESVAAPLSPTFAAPFHAVVPHQWDRHLPSQE